MFYSHEILTDRKHGVATIWLVATLGSKSSLRKITRKAIMEVNVPEACVTITDPSAPMALRLQGNLLVGLSKVFSEQCAYVLTDTQGLREKLRGFRALLKELEIEPNVAAIRPEQLNLQIDPSFNVDLDLGFDMSAFDTSFSLTDASSLLSPRTIASSQTSFAEDDEQMLDTVPQLAISSSDNVYEEESKIRRSHTEDLRRIEPLLNKPMSIPDLGDDVPAIGDDDFHIDEDGSLRILAIGTQSSLIGDDNASQIIPGDEESFELSYHGGEKALWPQEYPGTPPAASQHVMLLDSDNGLAHAGGANALSPDLEEVPTVRQFALSSPTAEQIHTSIEQEAGDGSGREEVEIVTGVAHQPRNRTKTVPVDIPCELPNRTLADWMRDYLETMDAFNIGKAGRISATQAKRNAEFWVLEQGIGGVHEHFRGDKHPHPLATLSGQGLLIALKGLPTGSSNRKRTRSVSDEGDAGNGRESRKVRARSREDVGAAKDTYEPRTIPDENEGITMGADDEEVEPQIGRAGEAPLSAQSESMPWNAYASSKKGSRMSSVRPARSITGASASVAPLDVRLPSSVGSKQISRLVQESPLEQRRRLLRATSQVGSTGHQVFEDDDEYALGLGGVDDEGVGQYLDDSELDQRLVGDLANADSFELYGPAAAVSTQQAADPQWIAATLEHEALNFLSFLQTTIEARQETVEHEHEHEHEGDGLTITFGELLSPENNNEIVAAQGFLHVLTLATKALIVVRQKQHFGDIELGTVPSLGEVGRDGYIED